MSIQLQAHQIKHVDKITNILSTSHCAFDLSPMGLGKTYVASYISQKLNLPLVVVCPKSAFSVWFRVKEEYDLNVESINSYASLRTGKHPLVVKNLIDNNYVYTASDKARKLFKEGVLLVIDEAQKTKNDSAQTACVAALSADLTVTCSKVMLLSASLMDKPSMAYNILKSSGLTTLDPRETLYKLTANMPNFNYRAVGIKQNIGNVFIEKILPNISSTMVQDIKLNKIIKNKCYNIEGEDLILYQTGIQGMQDAIEETTGKILSLGDFTTNLVKTQLSKSDIMIKEASRILEADERSQVILYIDYHVVSDKVTRRLGKYNPLRLNGKVPHKKRRDIIDKFQEDSSEHRLLIASLQVGGVGISLHDIHGKRPRHVYIMPNFNVLELHQATGRVYRQGVKSDVYISLVYGPYKHDKRKLAAVESNIMNRVNVKSSCVKRVMKDQAEQDILFACDYPLEE